MDATEWMVLFGGVAAILWVNWYFFLAERSVAAAVTGNRGTQEITVQVRGGYSPSTIRVKKGAPVRLTFDRQESSGCSEEVVLGDFGIRKFLPAHEKTAIEFVPEEAGTYEFTCGMSMLRGRIVVE